jgi:hypothetical protein
MGSVKVEEDRSCCRERATRGINDEGWKDLIMISKSKISSQGQPMKGDGMRRERKEQQRRSKRERFFGGNS